jgi:hypothetical protein
MSINTLLARLDAVRQTGPGRWLARCLAHEDRHPFRVVEDGRTLLHCFAGCPVDSVVSALVIKRSRGAAVGTGGRA